MILSQRAGLASAICLVGFLTACGIGKVFRTDFAHPVDSSVSTGWRISKVEVTVPDSLTISEERTFEPQADIVWREDPPGDRRAQIKAILAKAATTATGDLAGQRAVVMDMTVTEFHAMTFEAEALNLDVGVHNIVFVLRIRDAKTGEVLAGPDQIDASFPAKTGRVMAEARANGDSQKKQITTHVAQTIAAWLGTGPDNRFQFTRIGG